jgi:SAM-dependent methyltransferase
MAERPGYAYAGDFFDFVDASSGRSAARFLSRVAPELRPRSVLDVGCGRGVWLHAWAGLGVKDLLGLDGDYVSRDHLHVACEQFRAADVGARVELGRAFDLVECLEVAEHVPAAASAALLENLARHGDVILFSAGTPGQGGEHHVNEQPLVHWAERFAALGYDAFDFPRDAVRGVREIEPWYRYNALLYANAAGQARLSPAVLATRLPRGVPPPERGSPWWRLRCAILRALPEAAVHALARVKHRLMTPRG